MDILIKSDGIHIRKELKEELLEIGREYSQEGE